MNIPDGLLLIDKPSGVTSHDVVQLVRRTLGVRRVGHTGTLDPMAEGLLLLLVGGATKHQRALQGHDKIYEATLQLGTKTDTADATGTALRTAPVPMLAAEQIREVLAALHGPLLQTPPAYSAVKVQGRPAYWWARRNQPVALAPRLVQIRALDLVRATPESITVRVHCSAGTYVRTLAETIAERLGTVGHLTHLRRLAIGDWAVAEAKPLSWIREARPDDVARSLRPCAC